MGKLPPPPPRISNAADAEDALDATSVRVGCHKVHRTAGQGKNFADRPVLSVADARFVVVVIAVIVVVAIFVFVPIANFVTVIIFTQKLKEWCKEVFANA